MLLQPHTEAMGSPSTPTVREGALEIVSRLVEDPLEQAASRHLKNELPLKAVLASQLPTAPMPGENAAAGNPSAPMVTAEFVVGKVAGTEPRLTIAGVAQFTDSQMAMRRLPLPAAIRLT